MKRIYFLLPLLLVMATFQSSRAQTEKGNLMIGAQVANLGASFQNHSNVFHFDITPGAAYFFENNIAVGALVNLGLTAPKNAPSSFSYAVGPWGRYYFTPPESMNFSPHVAFFADGFIGFQGVTHSKEGGSTNGLGIKIGPGLAYFITQGISLDASLDYNLVLGFGNATTINRFGFNLGFQIFLPARGFSEKFRQGSL